MFLDRNVIHSAQTAIKIACLLRLQRFLQPFSCFHSLTHEHCMKCNKSELFQLHDDVMMILDGFFEKTNNNCCIHWMTTYTSFYIALVCIHRHNISSITVSPLLNIYVCVCFCTGSTHNHFGVAYFLSTKSLKMFSSVLIHTYVIFIIHYSHLRAL